MSVTGTMRTIASVEGSGPARLRLQWSDGSQVEVYLSDWLEKPAFAALQDAAEFAKVKVGDWGHSVEWPSCVEASADSLWLETLSAQKRHDARTFLEWRLRNGLSLSKAAEALGLSCRMVAYYSNAERPVPKMVLLACLGWEAGNGLQRCNRAAQSDDDRNL